MRLKSFNFSIDLITIKTLYTLHLKDSKLIASFICHQVNAVITPRPTIIFKVSEALIFCQQVECESVKVLRGKFMHR
jgi:hypothetical protein